MPPATVAYGGFRWPEESVATAHRASETGKPETRKCSRQRRNFVVWHGYAVERPPKGASLRTPARSRVAPDKPHPHAFSSAGGGAAAPGTRGSALSPSQNGKGGAQLQGSRGNPAAPSRRAVGHRQVNDRRRDAGCGNESDNSSRRAPLQVEQGAARPRRRAASRDSPRFWASRKSGCGSAWRERAPWKREVTGRFQLPGPMENQWKVHHG